MKRDCGQGELKPTSWEVVSCVGKDDKEQVQSYLTLDFALSCYRAQLALHKDVDFTDVRLYAKDKQGYMNCILYWSSRNGEVINRISEL